MCTLMVGDENMFSDFLYKDKIIQRVKELPLSNNAVKEHILSMAQNVEG